MNEEPFGPVAILNPMKGEGAMIEEANRLPYGLAAYAWTRDPARRRRLAAEVEAGMLGIDTGGVSAANAAANRSMTQGFIVMQRRAPNEPCRVNTLWWPPVNNGSTLKPRPLTSGH